MRYRGGEDYDEPVPALRFAITVHGCRSLKQRDRRDRTGRLEQ